MTKQELKEKLTNKYSYEVQATDGTFGVIENLDGDICWDELLDIGELPDNQFDELCNLLENGNEMWDRVERWYDSFGWNARYYMKL